MVSNFPESSTNQPALTQGSTMRSPCVKVFSKRRPKHDQPTKLFWAIQPHKPAFNISLRSIGWDPSLLFIFWAQHTAVNS